GRVSVDNCPVVPGTVAKLWQQAIPGGRRRHDPSYSLWLRPGARGLNSTALSARPRACTGCSRLRAARIPQLDAAESPARRAVACPCGEPAAVLRGVTTRISTAFDQKQKKAGTLASAGPRNWLDAVRPLPFVSFREEE